MEPSYTGDSLVLIPTIQLPVLPRSPRVLVPTSFTGPGKTLHEIYCTLGDRAEKRANRAAHTLGLGPAAVAERIRIFLGDGTQRESALAQLRDGIPPKLEKDCGRLVQYALPSETSSTQLEAFKCLVALTTRYPGLRCIFLDRESFQIAGNHESNIALLWDRPDGICGDQWHFHRNFAAACTADMDISSMVEDSLIQSLGSVLEQCTGLSILERILVASDCEGSSTFSRLIAIRYLGGILDLPSFWLQSGMMYRAVVQKLLERATLLLQDLHLDSERSDEFTPAVTSDIEGVDILCEILLVRMQTWLPDGTSSALTGEAWYPNLCHVLQPLRQPKTEDVLPRLWTVATAENFRELVPSQYEARIVDTLSATNPPHHERQASPQNDGSQRRNRLKLKTPIRRKTDKKRVFRYGTVACTLLKDIGNASNQPCLQTVASLSLLIIETVQRVKDNEETCVRMTERAFEVVCNIINICRDSDADLAPAMIRSIIQFSETLEKILTFVRGQVKGGFWQRLLRSMEDADLTTECTTGLKHAMDIFGVTSSLARSGMLRLTRSLGPVRDYRRDGDGGDADARQRHEELVAILKKGALGRRTGMTRPPARHARSVRRASRSISQA
ncbi:hypothetical protein C8R44DRAFT_738098 [Mycena epipterygia]|nr:hypothetical protein C8R44DRAFT_738098 [Mycena epipterygia]